MRLTNSLLALTGVLFMTGCSALVSLNSPAADDDATDAALLGFWHNAEDDATYIVRQAGSAYAVTYLEKSSTYRFEARLWRSGDARFLDLVSTKKDGFQIPAHTPVRVWIDGETLRFAFLDSGWLREQAALQLPVQMVGERTVTTASGDAVRSFLAKYGSDERAHGDVVVLHKMR